MRKTLSERLRESYLAEAPPPNPGAAPTGIGNVLKNRIRIETDRGLNFIIGYHEANRGWCVYLRRGGEPRAKLWAGPVPKLTDAFEKVATGL